MYLKQTLSIYTLIGKLVNYVKREDIMLKSKVKYLWSRGPAVGRFVHIEEVPGSNPGATTSLARCKNYEKIQNHILDYLVSDCYYWSIYNFKKYCFP